MSAGELVFGPFLALSGTLLHANKGSSCQASQEAQKRPFSKAGQRVFKGDSTGGQRVSDGNQNQVGNTVANTIGNTNHYPNTPDSPPPTGLKTAKNTGF